jgi:hypothetical protein
MTNRGQMIILELDFNPMALRMPSFGHLMDVLGGFTLL